MNTPVDGVRFERPSEVLIREVGDEMRVDGFEVFGRTDAVIEELR